MTYSNQCCCGLNDRDLYIRICLLSVSVMISVVNNREKEDVPGFISIWRIESEVLMGTIVVMGFLLILAQFMPQDIPLCTNPTRIFLEEDSYPYGYSILVGKMDQMYQMTKLNTIPNSKTKKPATKEIELENNKKVVFRPYGNAAYLFIQMGAYIGGPATFVEVGLASKPLHAYGKARFECEWIPKNSFAARMKGNAYKMLPDSGYGRVYTVVVVNCTFSQSVDTDGDGGELILHALHGEKFGKPERIVALKEEKRSYNNFVYSKSPPYDYLYCGSSLYGDPSH